MGRGKGYTHSIVMEWYWYSIGRVLVGIDTTYIWARLLARVMGGLHIKNGRIPFLILAQDVHLLLLTQLRYLINLLTLRHSLLS